MQMIPNEGCDRPPPSTTVSFGALKYPRSRSDKHPIIRDIVKIPVFSPKISDIGNITFFPRILKKLSLQVQRRSAADGSLS